MKKLILIILFFTCGISYAQMDNIPIANPVYDYLKNMNIKGYIGPINDQDLPIARNKVIGFLNEIDSYSKTPEGIKNPLSSVEKELLNKYYIQFDASKRNKQNTTDFLNEDSFSESLNGIFSDKQKFFLRHKGKSGNFSMELLNRDQYINTLSPETKSNAKILGFGGKIFGTIFDHLGYNLTVEAGLIGGNPDVAAAVEPWLRYNYKFVEGVEEIRSYSLTQGYLRYQTKPADDITFSAFIGRDKIKTGFGYDQSLIISGNGPDLDMIKFNIDWGILKFVSYTGATVGPFNQDRLKNYTKYVANNMFVFSLPKLFDLGVGEQQVYSGRGVDIAYLTPIGFYKFLEHDLQDRDNGTFYFLFQSNFLKNFQFNGTFYMDENFFGQLGNMSAGQNKTAYQVGLMTYEPAGIKNLALKFSYTKLRPFVYSHVNPDNSITGFGTILGSNIGPNADRIFINANYSFTSRVNLNLSYSFARKGNNFTDSQGNFINVGGDVNLPYNRTLDGEDKPFLAGERVNTGIFSANLKVEPLRDYVFDFGYILRNVENVTKNTSSKQSFGFVRLYISY